MPAFPKEPDALFPGLPRAREVAAAPQGGTHLKVEISRLPPIALFFKQRQHHLKALANGRRLGRARSLGPASVEQAPDARQVHRAFRAQAQAQPLALLKMALTRRL